MEPHSTPTSAPEAVTYVRRSVQAALRDKSALQRDHGMLRLDANESPFNSPECRYPDSRFTQLKTLWGRQEGIPAKCCYLCGGTEQAVDLTIRIFCNPGLEEVVAMTPSRSVYARRAQLNEVRCTQVPLADESFALDADSVVESVRHNTKVIFLCNPNSPTGNVLSAESIATLADLFAGIVVVDESYVEFARGQSSVRLINDHPNVVILRSFSHAWASAAVRLAVVVAHPSLISYYECMGLCHPVSNLVADYAERLVRRRLDVDKWVRQLVDERAKVVLALRQLPVCQKVYPSETNFLMVRLHRRDDVVRYLAEQGIAVLPLRGDSRIADCVRITVSLPVDNSRLLGALRKYCESRFSNV